MWFLQPASGHTVRGVIFIGGLSAASYAFLLVLYPGGIMGGLGGKVGNGCGEFEDTEGGILCFAQNRDTAVPVERNGDLQTLIVSLWQDQDDVPHC